MLHVGCRIAAEAPQPPAETILQAPSRVITTEALWSPDTPEYVPQYTCYCTDSDEPAGVHDSTAVQLPEGDTACEAGGTEAMDTVVPEAKGALGYGSSSVAPFAFRRTGR